MSDRVEELKGKIKKGVGQATGNERLQAKGEAEATKGCAKRKTKGALREDGGTIKEGVGKLTGSEATEVEGKAERLRGKAEQTG